MKNSLYIIDQKHKQIFYNWQSVFVSENSLNIELGNGSSYILGVYKSEKEAYGALNILIDAIEGGRMFFVAPFYGYGENNQNK